MFQENGLTAAQIGFSLIFWSVVTILAQMPIGILSDKLSRRNMLIVGNALVMTAFFTWAVVPTFTGVLAGFGLWGIAWAIDAACFQPMVYDHIRNKQKYLAVVGTCQSVELAAMALSSLCSFLVFLGYNTLIFATMVLISLGVFVLLGIPRDSRHNRRRVGQRLGLRDIACAARFVFTRPALLTAMCILALLNGCWNIEDVLGLIALQLGYPEYAVGTLYFLAMLCGVAGGLMVRWARRVCGALVPILIAGAGAMMAVTSFYYNMWSTFALCAFWMLLAMGKSISYADFQSNVSTDVRGRVTAILEIMLESASVLVYGILTMAETYGGGYRYGLYVLGVLLVIASVPMMFGYLKQQKNKSK